MKFDVVLTNPPFQDSAARKKTPHKLWIDFTAAVFERLLTDGGHLLQVSPASFATPSSTVLDLMRRHRTRLLCFTTSQHFPQVGSSFADYWITNTPATGEPTHIVTADAEFPLVLDNHIAYLPTDLTAAALAVHRKVMFSGKPLLGVQHDYVTCHNSRRHGLAPTLVTQPDADHPYPVFHTNNITWWSSIRQPLAAQPKVMWSRSGYTKPFFDPGQLGASDMAYYVPVPGPAEGANLAANLNTMLLRYVYSTAKWSGFGDEKVFSGLPEVPRDRTLTDEAMFAYFELTEEEAHHVRRVMEPRGRRTRAA